MGCWLTVTRHCKVQESFLKDIKTFYAFTIRNHHRLREEAAIAKTNMAGELNTTQRCAIRRPPSSHPLVFATWISLWRAFGVPAKAVEKQILIISYRGNFEQLVAWRETVCWCQPRCTSHAPSKTHLITWRSAWSITFVNHLTPDQRIYKDTVWAWKSNDTNDRISIPRAFKTNLMASSHSGTTLM